MKIGREILMRAAKYAATEQARITQMRLYQEDAVRRKEPEVSRFWGEAADQAERELGEYHDSVNRLTDD